MVVNTNRSIAIILPQTLPRSLEKMQRSLKRGNVGCGWSGLLGLCLSMRTLVWAEAMDYFPMRGGIDFQEKVSAKFVRDEITIIYV